MVCVVIQRMNAIHIKHVLVIYNNSTILTLKGFLIIHDKLGKNASCFRNTPAPLCRYLWRSWLFLLISYNDILLTYRNGNLETSTEKFWNQLLYLIILKPANLKWYSYISFNVNDRWWYVLNKDRNSRTLNGMSK